MSPIITAIPPPRISAAGWPLSKHASIRTPALTDSGSKITSTKKNYASQGRRGLGGRHGIRYDRQYRRSRSSAQRRCGDPNQQAIGRSRGGLSTKIHALTDALGNPTRFLLTPGQAHDLVGSDVLLTDLSAGAVIADKAYDADDRVVQPLKQAGTEAVIPPRSKRRTARNYDRELYKARHLIENFFCKLKHFRAIATRYDKLARNFQAAIQFAATLIWLN